MRGEMLDGDPAYALDVLRTSERRDDHDGVLRACEALVAVAAWQPVWELSGRLLDRARCRGIMVFIHDAANPAGGRYECVAGHHRCRYVVRREPPWFAECHGDPILARLAANCVRLLTPAPQAYPEHAAARWMAQSDARDVLARYVDALRLWWPQSEPYTPGWCQWWIGLGRSAGWMCHGIQHIGPPTGHSIMWSHDGSGRVSARVYLDGRVECGTVCPPLPVVPAREEVAHA